MAWFNYWTKTPITTIDDTHQFLVSKTTGAADVTTWANIKAKIKAYLSTENVTFANPLGVADAVNSGQAATFGQLATVENAALKKAGGTMTGQIVLATTGIKASRTLTIPTGTSDHTGVNRDLIFDDDNIYFKTNAGWKKATLTTF